MYKPIIYPILKLKDKVCLIACSDGISKKNANKVNEIIKILNSMGLIVVLASTLYKKVGPFSGNKEDRANELMKAFCDQSIKAIFDISGGDSANQIIDLLDYELIKENLKPFFGYSDLSVVLNALYSQVGMASHHFSIGKLIGKDSVNQVQKFRNSLIKGRGDLYQFPYKWIKGNEMKGVLIGGNIRCFLKLSGSKYMPDPKGKILLLESLSGGASRMMSLLTQLKQMGYLDKLNGLVLGTFTELESQNLSLGILEIVKEVVNNWDLPIIKTQYLGHEDNARCIIIGKELHLKEND